MPTYGTKNQPLVATTDTFNPPADINSATNWSATFANYRTVANATARNALTGSDRWQGLSVYQLDTNELYTWNGSGWVLNAIATAPRIELTRTTTQSLTSGTAATITGWTATENRGGFTQSNGVITIPRTGDYNVFAQLSFASSATGYRALTLLINSAISYRSIQNGVSGVETTLQLNVQSLSLSSGQTIAIQGLQNSGGSLNATGASVPMKFVVTWAGE